jgi:integral membrane protein
VERLATGPERGPERVTAPSSSDVVAGHVTRGRYDIAFNAYRVLAVLIGIGLLTLFCLGIPLQANGHPIVSEVVGPVHGILYVGYLLLSANLWQRERWPLKFAIPVAAAGFVPFLSFYAERKVTQAVRARRLLLAQERPSA